MRPAARRFRPGPRPWRPGASASWTFFGVFKPDHPQASSDEDLAVIDDVERAGKDWSPRAVALSVPARSVLQDAPVAVADALDQQTIAVRYRRRMHVERAQGRASVLLRSRESP